MNWNDWNWINVFFVFFSAHLAAKCFKEENNVGGWFNLFASSMNGAIVALRLGL
jgi:hypothetical protein